MPVDTALIDRVVSLKKRRDEFKDRFVRHQATVESARDRYNSIMTELGTFGIGSLDELRGKIKDITAVIEKELNEAEALMNQIAQQEKSLE